MAATQSAVDRLFAGLAFRFQHAFGRTLRSPGRFAAQVDMQIPRYRDAEPATMLSALRYRLRRDGLTAPLLGECFALYSGALRAPLSRDVLAAARWLAQGGIVELDDPASRRHALALAALACALHGDNVHLLAASDLDVSFVHHRASIVQRDGHVPQPERTRLGLLANNSAGCFLPLGTLQAVQRHQ